jgi:hypothetical protein
LSSGVGKEHDIDQHADQLRYAELEAAAQTDAQFTVDWADGRSVSVTGHCPACHGLTSTDFAPGIGSSKAFRGAKTWRMTMLPSPLTLYCECGHMHEGRPPEAMDTGCGRYWSVYLKDEERRQP